MGSTDSIPQNNSRKLNLHNWEYQQEIEEHPHQYGRYARLKNRMTGEQLIQYELYLYDKDEYTQFMSMCELRNSNPNLVNVSHLNKQNIKELCSLIYHLQIYIEDFPLRLCNIKDIPFPQNLYVLDRTLRGFSVIFQNVGHFHLTEDLICINEEGIIKVWMNQDLSKNFPNASNKQRLIQQTNQRSKNVENSMVWQLITIVQQLTNKQTVPSGYSFIDFLHSERVSELDFQKAIRLTVQYAEQTETEIPQFFQPVIRIIRERKGIYESQIDLNYNPRTSMKPKDEFNFSLIGNNFKQSKVQRIQSVKNPSSKSYAGSQSHTFADNLKRFDTSFRRKEANAFDKSYLRESPINKAADMLQNNYQRFTERIQKKLSYSSFSSPKIQSLNIIGSALGPRNSIQANSNAFSQIIQKNRCDALNESQIPARVTPPTYFSHIMQPLEHDKLIKKATLFSFGEDQKPALIKKSSSNSQLIQQIQDVQSIFTSRVSNDKQKCPKPLVKFTYTLNPNLEEENDMKKEQNYEQNSIPISPPSIDKSSTKRAEKVKQQKQNFFHSKETASASIKKKQKIQIKYINQQTQTYPQEFSNRKSISKPMMKQKEDLKEKKFEKINLSRKSGTKVINKKIQTENELGLDPEIYADLISYQSQIFNRDREQR